MEKKVWILGSLAFVFWWVSFYFAMSAALAQTSNWQCYTIGNTVTCSGMQNGRYVTCVTTYFNGTSSTQCY